jgi:hypothetical protein
MLNGEKTSFFLTNISIRAIPTIVAIIKSARNAPISATGVGESVTEGVELCVNGVGCVDFRGLGVGVGYP